MSIIIGSLPEQLEEAITDKTRVLILCSPSNPTGSCYSKEDLEGLAEVLRKVIPTFLLYRTKFYEYIVFDEEHISLLNVAPDLKDRVALINGFSKGFAMTGWRLGYLAGPEELVKAVGKIQSQETSAPSSISQAAGFAAYSGPLDKVLEMRASFKERRDFMVEQLNNIEGVSCFSPWWSVLCIP